MEKPIVFTEEKELCYDGVNVKTYKPDEPYEATNAHEARIFNLFVQSGQAKVYEPKKDEKVKEPENKEKTAKPKAKKTTKKSKKK